MDLNLLTLQELTLDLQAPQIWRRTVIWYKKTTISHKNQLLIESHLMLGKSIKEETEGAYSQQQVMIAKQVWRETMNQTQCQEELQVLKLA